jgi:hypothetical protein
MFRVIYTNDQKLGVYRVMGRAETLEEAKKLRQVSGDIVVTEEGAVCTDPSWLWGYENEEPGLYSDLHYAKRLIQWQLSNREPYLKHLRQREIQ